ncbi:MAG: MiaB/RimO family radical SAM methylthiotransferase [Longimicrobiales bacterium]|nr:MiaB/RimO family radical SAM methylthiotransferase [Longimicrobiales bacterium]
MRVHLHTFGCKANQYDTDRMRQELVARGARPVDEPEAASLCIVNTCTVTRAADAEARRMVRRIRRRNPDARIVVAGCSAALHTDAYSAMEGVSAVVPGHDPVAVARAGTSPEIVQIEDRRSLDRVDLEPVGGDVLRHRTGGTRGWLKIQDGCDRRCAFCATRLARGSSRSREADEVVREARQLASRHPEIVLTGIHIGHYGRDLSATTTLGALVTRLLDEVPEVRFRLGSIEATEICDDLIARLEDSGGRLAPHLHMPLQSGADPVLRAMRRWHTREAYRRCALEIAERVPILGLGADLITGFPGETEADHATTVALVEDLPFTYLHVFPFSPREGTEAATLAEECPVPQRVAGERSRDLRERVERKGAAWARRRAGEEAIAVVERGESALTGDYLRVGVAPELTDRVGCLTRGVLQMGPSGLYIEISSGARGRAPGASH